jgi:hypothetical protein
LFPAKVHVEKPAVGGVFATAVTSVLVSGARDRRNSELVSGAKYSGPGREAVIPAAPNRTHTDRC